MIRFAHIAKLGAHVPVLRQVLDFAYRRQFNAAAGQIRLFRGIYADFAGATRAIPADRLEGYDNEPSAERLLHDRTRISSFDYPVMFWLAKLLPDCKLLFDWGGNVGISFFGFRGYLSYPEGLTWLVCDVPAVNALGESIAAREAQNQLEFTTSLDRLSEADLLLAAGSLHFMENPFQMLRSLPALPRHILINKSPTYDAPSAVTLHNFGSAFCPYHLFNRSEFVGRFEELGYRLRDTWACADLGCEIPFFPQHSIRAYSGFYFSRAAMPTNGS